MEADPIDDALTQALGMMVVLLDKYRKGELTPQKAAVDGTLIKTRLDLALEVMGMRFDDTR